MTMGYTTRTANANKFKRWRHKVGDVLGSFTSNVFPTFRPADFLACRVRTFSKCAASLLSWQRMKRRTPPAPCWTPHCCAR